MALAVILSLCFGPFGVWYATWGMRQSQLVIFFAGGTVLALFRFPNAGWSPFVLISVIWSVLAVKAYNRQFTKMGT